MTAQLDERSMREQVVSLAVSGARKSTAGRSERRRGIRQVAVLAVVLLGTTVFMFGLWLHQTVQANRDVAALQAQVYALGVSPVVPVNPQALGVESTTTIPVDPESEIATPTAAYSVLAPCFVSSGRNVFVSPGER